MRRFQRMNEDLTFDLPDMDPTGIIQVAVDSAEPWPPYPLGPIPPNHIVSTLNTVSGVHSTIVLSEFIKATSGSFSMQQSDRAVSGLPVAHKALQSQSAKASSVGNAKEVGTPGSEASGIPGARPGLQRRPCRFSAKYLAVIQ